MDELISSRIRTAIQARIGIAPRVYGEKDNFSFVYPGSSGQVTVNVSDFDPDFHQPVDSNGIAGSEGMLAVIAETDNESYPHRYFDAALDQVIVDAIVNLYGATRAHADATAG